MPTTEKDAMKMNDLQKKLLATYEGGDYAHIQRGEDLRNCGDTLLQFLFAELDDDVFKEAAERGEPPETVAARRLNRAAIQIMDVLTAL